VVSNNVVHNVQSLVFLVPKNIDRDSLMMKLKEHDVESTLGTYSLSNTAYYSKAYHDEQINTLILQQNTITLPCYENVEVDKICSIIKKIVK
jgi:dTDP-4-amino-4,6-dideoxygalactose transaminase